MASMSIWKNRAKGGILTGVVVLLNVALLSGTTSAAHDPQLLFDPTVNKSGENVVYTLLVTNEGDSIENVEITASLGFENFEEVGTPSGWTYSAAGTTITYLADENGGIFSGESVEFEFQAMTPILGMAAESTDNWVISTTDNTGAVENFVIAVTVDNLAPTFSAKTVPSPAPAGNVWLVVTASEMLEALDNVYLTVENSLIENAEQREYWENLIKIQGPIPMSTTDLINWKGIITITENLEDNAPRVLVLPLGASDLVGNQMADAFTQPIEVDTRRPLLAQVSALPSETNQSTLTLGGVAEDAVGGTYMPVGGLTVRINTNYDFLLTTTSADGSFEVEVELSEGSNLIGVCAVDAAGNTSDENLQAVVLDNVPPVIQDYRLVKDGAVLTTENNAQIDEARPEVRVNVYDYWMGVKTAGMSLMREDNTELELEVEFENNLLRGVLKQDLTAGTYIVTVSATDGLTASLNHSTSWWVFGYGSTPAPVQEVPSPTELNEVVLPPPEELPVWGFPPPENIVVEGAAPGQEFSVCFGPYPFVVSEIEMTLTENRENIRLSLDFLEDLPPALPEPENLAAYSYFRILSDLPENIIQTTRVVFSVDKSWIERNVVENTVALHRYGEEDGAWEPLETVEVRDNETHVFYSAQVEGLSIFAVGGTLRVAPISPPEEAQFPGVGGLALLMAAVALSLISASVWILRLRVRKG